MVTNEGCARPISQQRLSASLLVQCPRSRGDAMHGLCPTHRSHAVIAIPRIAYFLPLPTQPRRRPATSHDGTPRTRHPRARRRRRHRPAAKADPRVLVKTVRIVEIAELLGVSKQRAHQIADDPGFPARAPGTEPAVGSARGHGVGSGGAARSLALVRAAQPVGKGRQNDEERDGHGDEDGPRDRHPLRGAEHVVRLRPSVRVEEHR